MGLDWVLDRRRPRKGKKRQFARARAALTRLREADAPDAAIAAADRELTSFAHCAEDEIGAPRVGIDARATRWYLKEVHAPEVARAKERGEAPLDEATALKEAHGKYVLELATEKGGFAGGSFLVSSLDYGAGAIDSCGDVLRDFSEAWVDHSAKQAAAFAKKIRRAIARAESPLAKRAKARKARARGDAKLGREVAVSGSFDDRVWMPRPIRHGLSFEDQVQTLEGMASWLEFWSKRGYGFIAWS